jgi:hypothetical protein
MRVLKLSHGLLIAILLFGLSEAQSRRAINTTIPGQYTAIVADKNGGTGIGLVEVYDLGP